MKPSSGDVCVTPWVGGLLATIGWFVVALCGLASWAAVRIGRPGSGRRLLEAIEYHSALGDPGAADKAIYVACFFTLPFALYGSLALLCAFISWGGYKNRAGRVLCYVAPASFALTCAAGLVWYRTSMKGLLVTKWGAVLIVPVLLVTLASYAWLIRHRKGPEQTRGPDTADNTSAT